MGKVLEVCEFESITGNPDYAQDPGYRYLEEPVFKELISFIHECAAAEGNADALDFFSVSYRRAVGDVVTVKNYVGLIQMKNGYQIQVLPKISFGRKEEEGRSQTKRIFLKMLKTMKDFPGKVFNDASLKADRMNLYEIFIRLYLQEVRCLVKHGIQSGYLNREENLNCFKGKLLIGRQMKTNPVHRERFYVSYDEFHVNRAENRLVKATLLKLQKLTESAENAKEIRQLLSAFEPVEASVNYEKDFAAVVINRNTKAYETLMQWSKVFLMNKSFATFSGSKTARALLFPMETLFERYVGEQIRKRFSENGWEVTVQGKGKYLFTEPEPQFALRPDIVCKKGERVVILDTKWKRLTDRERKNYGISQGDMYQMYAYSKKYRTPEIWLLYPVTDEMRGHEEIRFDSGDQTTVRIHFVDLADIEENLADLMEKTENVKQTEIESAERTIVFI